MVVGGGVEAEAPLGDSRSTAVAVTSAVTPGTLNRWPASRRLGPVEVG